MSYDLNDLSNPGRREFLKKSAVGTAVAAAAFSGLISPVHAAEEKSIFHFPPLPYPENGLEPYISSRTLSIHHDKHHKRFMEEVVARVKGTDYQNDSLETIIKNTHGGINMTETLYLMALLSWHHDFYWKSMKPGGGGEMPETLKQELVKNFGSVDEFKKKFREAAMTMGSGWAWLVYDNGKLLVTYTNYHETPLVLKQKPLLTIDCWEHAYYLDYQDRKGDYVDAFINKLANWQFVEETLVAAVEKKPAPPAKVKTK